MDCRTGAVSTLILCALSLLGCGAPSTQTSDDDRGGESSGDTTGAAEESTVSSDESSSEPDDDTTGSSGTTTSSSTTTDATATTTGTTEDGSESTGDVVGTPTLLSQTGLFADIATEILAEGVRPYEPQFHLWSDGSDKRRWFYLPPGTQIDTSDMNDWQFPIGTKIWKEFVRDGVRVETRLLEKLPPERASEGWSGWLMVTYIWNDEGTDAELNTTGMQNAKGTPHDVPDEDTCNDCHESRREKPLGVSAIQLSHDGPGMTLMSLAAEGLLTDPPTAPLVVPGDEMQREVLGYLHANCGHCHREGAPANSRIDDLTLWIDTDRLESVENTQAYTALVNAYAISGDGSVLTYRVHGQNADESELIRRITSRGTDIQMPQVGSELVDEDAVALIRAWIATLPAPGQ